jgi:hypothetical protein
MIVIADIIGEVVSAVSTKVFTDATYEAVKAAIKQQLNTNVSEITYLHGHPVEIITTLTERDGATNELKFKKYPLIAMFQDMAENPANGMMEASLQIIIATSTQPELKATQRYATTFKPILLPLYDLFMLELNKHKSVRSQYTIDHQKYDRVFWGTVTNLMEGTQVRMFNDYLDAVELQNVKLTFFENNC